jgi:hypothetical protein
MATRSPPVRSTIRSQHARCRQVGGGTAEVRDGADPPSGRDGIAAGGLDRVGGGGPLAHPRVRVPVFDPRGRDEHLAGVGGAALTGAERDLEAELEVVVLELHLVRGVMAMHAAGR